MMWRAILKTFCAAVILYTVLPEVRPLICNQCSGESGTCNFAEVTCPTKVTTCFTTSITVINGEQISKQISNGCGSCSEPISFNTGSLVISESSKCCNSDHCNTRIDAEPVNNTLTGLKCQGCFDRSYESCRNSEKTVNCVGAENYCKNASGTEALPSAGNSFFAKGCVSKRVTESLDSMSDHSILFDGKTQFCQGNFCNSDQPGGTTTAAPGVTTSSPVMSESSTKQSTNSNGVTTRRSVMSEPTAEHSTNSNGVTTSSPVMSETNAEQSTNRNGVTTSRPVMSETTAKDSTNSNGNFCILATVLGLFAVIQLIV